MTELTFDVRQVSEAGQRSEEISRFHEVRNREVHRAQQSSQVARLAKD
jgi:hypothetical protein